MKFEEALVDFKKGKTIKRKEWGTVSVNKNDKWLAKTIDLIAKDWEVVND